jgi:hypothetical protein
MNGPRLALPLLALVFASLAHGAVKNVVLVHGAFVDGCGWIELERFMSDRAKSQAIKLHGSHAIFLSHPKEVASLIEKAARAAE